MRSEAALGTLFGFLFKGMPAERMYILRLPSAKSKLVDNVEIIQFHKNAQNKSRVVKILALIMLLSKTLNVFGDVYIY